MLRPPSLGAWPDGAGARFRVWAPAAQRLELVLEQGMVGPATFPMAKQADGTFTYFVPQAGVGDLYRYRIDGQGPFPDPASRFQPQGVHGPSQVVDPRTFVWT